MLDFIYKTQFRVRGYMTCLICMYLDLVYELECLLYDIRRLCALFLFYFFILCPFEYWSNPRFDQDLKHENEKVSLDPS